MRYQKEFEEVFANDVDPLDDTFAINEKTGEYIDPDDRALYRGFVAGIESGLKKKEPTLLEQVKEWRNSNISDEGLLNNIKNALNKPDDKSWVGIYLFYNLLKVPKYIDLLKEDGSIVPRFNTNTSKERIDHVLANSTMWRASKNQY